VDLLEKSKSGLCFDAPQDAACSLRLTVTSSYTNPYCRFESLQGYFFIPQPTPETRREMQDSGIKNVSRVSFLGLNAVNFFQAEMVGVILPIHLANAPILPLTALYVKQLGGSDGLMTATVLTAQLVMVPVALLAGRYGDRWGRKPVLAIAFWILPVRILTYVFARSPQAVVWLQCLDGIGAGIYGVVVISLAADLTRGRAEDSTHWLDCSPQPFPSAEC
jgi:Major Facilitator Superfamily